MADNKIICSRCGTENEPDYAYCKNCGDGLNQSFGGTQYTPPNFARDFNYYEATRYDYSALEPTIDGVDTKKLQEYVGDKKRNFFLRLFIAMKKTGKKMFFAWPVILFGFLMAVPFVASWFFYRKMHKIGAIICAVAIALTACSTVVNYDYIYKTTEMAVEYFEETNESGAEVISVTDFVPPEQSTTEKAVSTVLNMATYIGIFYLAMYGYTLYFKSAVTRIKKFDLKGEHDLLEYKKLGGTNLCAAIVFPTITAIICGIIELIPVFSLIIERLV